MAPLGLLCFGLLGLLGFLRLLGLLGLFGLGAAHELVVVLVAAEFAAVPEGWAFALPRSVYLWIFLG